MGTEFGDQEIRLRMNVRVWEFSVSGRGSGVGVQGLGFRGWGSGVGVQGSG